MPVSPPADRDPKLNHVEHRLENGLRVILHPDRRLPRVAVNLLYRVGGRDDPAGRSGLAHLLEHLMFMGTRRVPEGRFDQLLERTGAWSNAYTSEDYTVYYDVGPSRLLETLLWLEADRVVGVAGALTDEKLHLQRDIVLNELWQDYHNAPYGMAELAKPRLMYPPRHPYARPVIGSAKEVRAITVADVRRHLRRFYTPGNASLVIAGDIDPQRTLELVRRYFGWIDGAKIGPRADRRPPPAPRRRREVSRTLRDRVELPKLLLSWYSPAHFEPGDAEMDLVGEVLATGKRSRLHRTLVHDARLALRVEAYQLSRPLGSVFEVGVTARSGVDLERLEGEVFELVSRLSSAGPTTAELRRARRRFETSFLSGLQQLHRRAELLNTYAEAIGRPDGIEADLDRYQEVSRSSVVGTCGEVLGRAGCRVWVIPGQGSRA
jgi:predicted Zn-dependent peptidase